MDASGHLEGHLVVPSPSGVLLACLTNAALRVCYSNAPEKHVDFAVRSPFKDISAVKWSSDSSHVLLFAPQWIEVINLENEHERIRLRNGSGGLGRFAAVDFVHPNKLLTVWEFGKAKIWDLITGQGVDVDSVKTSCDGRRWEARPSSNSTAQTLAYISRPSADDLLILHFLGSSISLPATRLSTVDVKSLSWSPDGHWIGLLDTPRLPTNVHIFTPDGHHFRSYPSKDPESNDLGVKAIAWSPDARIMALSRYDERIELLSTRTFSPLAIIEHSTTIDQRLISGEGQAPIWQESVSASAARSYHLVPQPVSPPLSRLKPSAEPSEVGVAEAKFSCDGRYLASRDARMLNTVWIWDMDSLRAHAVLIQHSNVRRVQWHPAKTDQLLLDCGESIAYLFSAGSRRPPKCLQVSLTGTIAFSFLPQQAECHDRKPALLAATKGAFCLVYPYGIDESSDNGLHARDPLEGSSIDDNEDSIFDVLSAGGAAKRDMSYTERVDFDVNAENGTIRLDDTFHGKHKPYAPETDPLDDSDIF